MVLAAGINLTREMPAVEAVRQLLLVQIGEIQRQAPLALADDLKISADAVHDLRVAIRRSLAVLEGFAPWLDPDWICKTSKGYHKILRPLGRMRDLDVLAEWIAGLSQAALGMESDFRHRLDRDRHSQRCKLHDLLESKDFQKWAARQSAELTLPDATLQMALPAITARGKVHLYRVQDCQPVLLYRAAAELTVYHAVLPDLADRPADTGQNAGLPGDEATVSVDILHRLRVAAKNFRYLVEACQPALAQQPGWQLIHDFRLFQDLLGGWHDAVVAVQYLDRFLKRGNPCESVTAMREEWLKKQNDQQSEFRQLWSAMTSDWFHERLSKALSRN